MSNSLDQMGAQLKAAQAAQNAVVNMRIAIAREIMCELVATETVLDTDLDDLMEGEEWKGDNPENIENAKERLDIYADLAVYGADTLLQQLGVIRKVPQQ